MDVVKFDSESGKWNKTVRIGVSAGFSVASISTLNSKGDLREVLIRGIVNGSSVTPNVSYFLCNKFYYTGDSTSNKWDNVYGVYTNSLRYGFYVVYDINDYPTEDDLKAMVEDESTIFYYVLENPVESEIVVNENIRTYDSQTWIMTAKQEVNPRMVCEAEVTEVYDYVNDGLIGYYTGRGRSNDDENKNVLPDLSGNGNDLDNKNFAYTINSGYGDGYIQYDGIDDYSNILWSDTNARSSHVVFKDVILTKESPYSSQVCMIGNDRSNVCLITNGKISAVNNYGYLNGNNLGNELYTKNFVSEKGILNLYLGNDKGLIVNPEYVYNLCLGSGNYYGNPTRFACAVKIYDFLLYDRKLSEDEIRQNYNAANNSMGSIYDRNVCYTDSGFSLDR